MGWVVAIPAENSQAQCDGLAARLARGEAAALEELIALYGYRVGRLANRLLAHGNVQDAEDVVQEVFLAAWEGRKRYRGDASIWTYLAAITANRCRLRLRRRSAVPIGKDSQAPADEPALPAANATRRFFANPTYSPATQTRESRGNEFWQILLDFWPMYSII